MIYHSKLEIMKLICECCNFPITDDDMLELKYGLFIHASCQIEYYSGLRE